jgi:uncharacterized protein (TIRG00374 family)
VVFNAEKHWKNLIVFVVLILFLYIFGVLYVGWQDVWKSFQRIGVGGFILILSLSLVNYSLRFLRWKYYLSIMKCQISFKDNLMIYLSGFSLAATPGKIGELIRSFFLKSKGISYSKSISVLLTERISDLVALLVLLSVTSLNSIDHPGVMFAIVSISGIVTFFLFFLKQDLIVGRLYKLTVVRNWMKLSKILNLILRISADLKVLIKWRYLFFGLVVGVIAWIAESLGFYLIIYLVSDIEVSLIQAIFIYSLAILVGALTLLPGGIGSVEVVVLTLLISFNIGHSEAVAITVIARITTLWFGVSIGSLAILFGGGLNKLGTD